VVDVAHDGDHRRPRLLHHLGGGGGLGFGQQRLGVVQLGGDRAMTQLGDYDHRRVLVQHLVDGHHLAQLHQDLDDLGCLQRHLVREVGHRDRLRHRHVAHHRGGGLRRRCAATLATVLTLAVSARAAAPAAGTAGIAAGLQRALLGRVFRPAGGELARLDLLDARLLLVLLALARLGRGPGGRLVQRARGGGRGGRGCRLGRLDDARRRRTHGVDGGHLGLDGAAAAVGLGAGCLIGAARGFLLGLHALDLGARGRFLGLRLGKVLLLTRGGFAQLALRHFGALPGLGHLPGGQLGGPARLFLAALALGLVDHRQRWFGERHFRRRGLLDARLVALDEHALLAYLHLNGARLAGAVSLLDLRGRLAGQRDLLLLRRLGLAMRPLERGEQA